MKQKLIKLIPDNMHVQLKYWFNKISGNEENEIKLLQELIDKGSNVIDIGANRGNYSYALNKLKCNIIIFEPNSYCYKILKKWAENKKNIILYNIALSDTRGYKELYIPIDKLGILHDASASLNIQNSNSNVKQRVELKKLDDYNLSNIDFIKIDVEGHENSVINGAINTIKSNKPTIIIEIEKRHNASSFEEIRETLEDLNYSCFFYYKNEINSINKFKYEIHQNMKNLTIKNKTYINNFIFINKDKIINSYYKKLFLDCK